MGQPVAVVEKPSRVPGVVRFDTNRNLTGTGHEIFRSPEQAVGTKPAPTLARRLFESGRVDGVHVYMNMVTVDLKKGFDSEGLKEIIEGLYTYYHEGWVPPVFDEPAAEAAPVAEAPAATGDAAADALAEAAKRVPAHLLERSRLAKERALAKKG